MDASRAVLDQDELERALRRLSLDHRTRIDCNPNDFVLWHVPGERPGGPTAQPGGGAKA